MSWITRLFRRKSLERELNRELRFHLDAHTDDLVRLGVSHTEARRAAERDLGGEDQVKEAARDARGTRWLEDWWQDTRFALRAMRRSPAFSSAAILTLAIGIGANTAVWSIVDALMMRVLPVEQPENLKALRIAGIEEQKYRISFPGFERLRSTLPDTVPIAAMSSATRMYATIDATPEGVLTQLVTGSWFSLLGVGASYGRVLGQQDDGPVGTRPVVVLSDGFWTRRFGRDPKIIGKSIRVNGAQLTVVGISEAGFFGVTVGQSVDLWVPLVMQHEVRYKSNASSDNADNEKPWLPQNGIAWLTLLTRVQPTAAAEITGRLDRQYSAELRETLANSDSATRAYGLREHLVLEPIEKGFSPLRQQFGDPLLALMASVGLVLLICCGNLASLLLARSATRAHEISVRVSLGARPGRLVRQALTESLTLGALGAAASLLVARAGSAALLRAASTAPTAIPLGVHVDARMLAFTAAVALFTSVLFGLAPALRVARADLYDSFRSAGRVLGASARRVQLERLLVIAQIALSLVLVTSAGLFVRTLQNLMSIDSGYDREHIIAVRLDVRAAGYDYGALPGLYQRMLDAARAVPGIRSASLSLHGLAGGARRTSSFAVPGRMLAPGDNVAQENYVTPEYFGTTGIRLLQGRTFEPGDRPDGPKVAIVSESMARHFFGRTDVLGARFGYDSNANVQVIGVIRDARVNELREEPQHLVFYPLAQGPQEYITSLEARTDRAPETVIPALRRAIGGLDPNLPVREVVTLSDLIGRGLMREKLVARLVSSFGLIALLLAGLGLYGVMAYSVSRRLSEFGIRIALGASPGTVSWLVLRETLQVVIPGVVLGLAIWFPLLGLARGLVYGLSPHDPVTVAGATGVLMLVAFSAALIPAWRASRVDPINSIRSE